MTRVALGIVALVLAACSAPMAVANTLIPAVPTRSSTAASSGPLTRLEGPLTELVSGWHQISGVAISPRWVAWHGLEKGSAQRDPEVIAVHERSTGSTRVLAKAPDPAGLIAWLRISDEYAVWAEWTDRRGVSDWKVRSATLPDGTARTIVDAPAGAEIGDRPEFDLRGNTVIISARFPGASRQQLVRVDLASDGRSVLLEAEPGEMFGWPTFEGTTFAVESHREAADDSVVIGSLTRPGERRSVPRRPSSEPSLSGSWLAYKAAQRYRTGTIEIRRLADVDGPATIAGPGEDPRGVNGVFVWRVADDLYAYDARSRSSYVFSFTKREVAWDIAHDGRTVAVVVRTIESTPLSSIRVLSLPVP
jgi:hypothetical protein